jgi:GNAT superfamily N-acetyltransferase
VAARAAAAGGGVTLAVERVVTPAQHAHVALLQAEILPHDTPLGTDHGWWWLVMDGGDPVAFAGMVPSCQWADAMYLCRTGVLPAYRGRGLQKRLIRIRAKIAKCLGAAWLVTDTTDNPASANALIHCGFRLYDPSRPWAWKRSLYWRKAL